MIIVYILLFGENILLKDLNIDENISILDINDVDLKRINEKEIFKKESEDCYYIELPKDVEYDKEIEWMADFVYKYKTNFYKVGVEDIIFTIVWKGLQGNMYFKANEIEKLAKLDIDIDITYIFEKEDYIVNNKEGNQQIFPTFIDS